MGPVVFWQTSLLGLHKVGQNPLSRLCLLIPSQMSAKEIRIVCSFPHQTGMPSASATRRGRS